MASAFLSLRDGVVAALLADPAVAGGRVRPGRGTPLPEEWDSGVFVGVVRARGQRVALHGPARQWDTGIAVQASLRGTAPDADVEAALDALLVEVYARLDALTPPPGVHAVTLDPAITWEVDEADRPVISATLVLVITHTTTTATLE